MPRRDRLIAALVLLSATGMLWLGVAMTRAGVDKLRAEAFMTHWAAQGGEPEVRAWEAAQLAAAAAASRYPVANGDYEDRLGRVYLWRHYRQPFGAESARASRELAVAALQRSLAARPVAPDTHARLARSHLYLLQLNAPLARHMALARAQGPWVVEVNREIAEVGFIAWPSLTKESKKNALNAFCAVLLADDLSGFDLLMLADRVRQSKSSCSGGRLVHEV